MLHNLRNLHIPVSGRSLSAFFLHKPANLLAFSYAEKEEPEKLRAYETLEKNHGRIEKRKYKISQDIDYLMKLDKRFDKKKKMTYEKMSMLYTYHLEYMQELIFEKIEENI